MRRMMRNHAGRRARSYSKRRSSRRKGRNRSKRRSQRRYMIAGQRF